MADLERLEEKQKGRAIRRYGWANETVVWQIVGVRTGCRTAKGTKMAVLYKARFWFTPEGIELHRQSWILRPASPLES